MSVCESAQDRLPRVGGQISVLERLVLLKGKKSKLFPLFTSQFQQKHRLHSHMMKMKSAQAISSWAITLKHV